MAGQASSQMQASGNRLHAPSPPHPPTHLRLQQRAALPLAALKQVGIQVGGAGRHGDQRRLGLPGGAAQWRCCRCCVHGGGICKVQTHVVIVRHLMPLGRSEAVS